MSQQHGIITSVEVLYDYASLAIYEESGSIHGGIQKYIDARYVYAREMIWQLLGSVMLNHSYRSHFLVAHLSDKQLIYFQEGVEAESVVRKSNSFTPTLTMVWLSHIVYVTTEQTARVGYCIFVHVYYGYSKSYYYVEFRINNKNGAVLCSIPSVLCLNMSIYFPV
jgi:hypothetical protein